MLIMDDITTNKSEPSPKSKRRGLSLFSLSTAFLVDRAEDQALAILWPYMYRSLGASIGKLGFVLGISQLVATLTLPLWGYATDRYSRKTLLVFFTGIWGLWTLIISFVDTLPQLIIVRVLSTFGLGVFIPAAFSLISDLFGAKHRGRATGVMRSASMVGLLASFGLLPLLAAKSPEAWRWGFVIVGLASFISGLFMMFIREPTRGGSEAELQDVITDDTAGRFAFKWSDLRELVKIRSWWLLLSRDTLDAIGFGIFIGWVFTYLNQLGLGQKTFLAIIPVYFGLIGGYIGFGWLGDRLDVRYPSRGRVSLVLVGLILRLPFIVIYLTTGGDNLPLLMVSGLLTALAHTSVSESVNWPIAQAVLPPEIRGSSRAATSMVAGAAAALTFFLSGIVADRIGINSMLLVIVTIPMLLNALAWVPILFTYPRDHMQLRDLLGHRREELIAATD